MKMQLSNHGLLLSSALVLVIGAAFAQEKEKTPAAATPDMAEMTKRAEAYATPGPEHKVLSQMAGTWDVESKFYVAGPEADPMVTKGVDKAEMVLGGRYLREEFSSDFMGQPFQGIGFTGYNNFKKRYESTWIDSMGTGILFTQGAADRGGKTITFEGKMDEPATGQKDKPIRCVLTLVSEDKHVFEMFDAAPGGKGRVLEITYTRKK